MPLDKKKQSSKVEGFKLTDEYRAWFKNFQRVNEVSEMIEQGLKIEFGQFQKMKMLYEEVSGKKAELLKLAPPQPTKEIEGQEVSQRDAQKFYGEGEGEGEERRIQ